MTEGKLVDGLGAATTSAPEPWMRDALRAGFRHLATGRLDDASACCKRLLGAKLGRGPSPHELGRKPLGRISIVNSDAEGSAYLHAAIDAAARAVDELGAG